MLLVLRSSKTTMGVRAGKNFDQTGVGTKTVRSAINVRQPATNVDVILFDWLYVGRVR